MVAHLEEEHHALPLVNLAELRIRLHYFLPRLLHVQLLRLYLGLEALRAYLALVDYLRLGLDKRNRRKAVLLLLLRVLCCGLLFGHDCAADGLGPLGNRSLGNFSPEWGELDMYCAHFGVQIFGSILTSPVFH